MKTLLSLQVGDVLRQQSWMPITQTAINQFADATGDHQWIHIDAERCKAESPFGKPIAYGFMTASIMPKAFESVIESSDEIASVINYGIDKLRFLEPVRVNSEIAYEFEVSAISQKNSGLLYEVEARCLIKGSDKPALIGGFLMLVVKKA